MELKEFEEILRHCYEVEQKLKPCRGQTHVWEKHIEIFLMDVRTLIDEVERYKKAEKEESDDES